MSPLVASPNRGYPDWQRINNYDSGVLWTANAISSNATQNSPVLDVSRYAYLAGRLTDTQTGYIFIVNWYADALAATQLGGRAFTITDLSTNPAQIRLANLGPFVRVTLAALAGANYTPSASVFATNRDYPIEFIPINSSLIDEQALAFAAGNTPVYPFDYYAGPVRYQAVPTTASFGIALQYLNNSNVWDTIDQFTFPAANTVAHDVTITPPGQWRVLVINLGAAANLTLTLTASTTGAA